MTRRSISERAYLRSKEDQGHGILLPPQVFDLLRPRESLPPVVSRLPLSLTSFNCGTSVIFGRCLPFIKPVVNFFIVCISIDGRRSVVSVTVWEVEERCHSWGGGRGTSRSERLKGSKVLPVTHLFQDRPSLADPSFLPTHTTKRGSYMGTERVLDLSPGRVGEVRSDFHRRESRRRNHSTPGNTGVSGVFP